MLKPYEPDRDLISIREAAALLRGRGGKKPSLVSVYKWAREGCRPRAGLPVVVLRTQFLGGNLMTRRSWVAEFEAERDRLHVRKPPPQPLDCSPRSRRASQRRAAKILDEAGVK